MNKTLATGLLVTALGVAMSPASQAAVNANHSMQSNAVDKCQAFTPGPSNTIRNRVVGAENIGSAIAVACNFTTFYNGVAASSLPPRSLQIYFANNNTSGTITVSCTLLTSYQGDSAAYAVTKTTTAIAAGGVAQGSLTWTQADNPTAGATNLGNYLVGVNCTLPTGAVINDSYLTWSMDNGI